MTEKKLPLSLSKSFSKYAILSTPPSVSEPSLEVVTPDAAVTPKNSFKKSYAQVDPLVSPEWVSPKGLASAEPKQDKNGGDQKGGAGRTGRSNPLTVRLSKSEREIIRAKADKAGCSVNAYVKTVVLGSAYKPAMDPELRRTLLDLNRELTAQGRNLNQIAKQLNSGQATAPEAEMMIDVLSRSLLRTHQCVRKALG